MDKINFDKIKGVQALRLLMQGIKHKNKKHVIEANDLLKTYIELKQNNEYLQAITDDDYFDILITNVLLDIEDSLFNEEN